MLRGTATGGENEAQKARGHHCRKASGGVLCLTIQSGYQVCMHPTAGMLLVIFLRGAVAAGEILCSQSSSFLLLRPLRVEGSPRLEHPVSEVDELAHRRPDQTHLALAPLAQALRPSLEEGAAPQGGDGREVENAA